MALDLEATVRQCPRASTAGGGDCYSLGYSAVIRPSIDVAAPALLLAEPWTVPTVCSSGVAYAKLLSIVRVLCVVVNRCC